MAESEEELKSLLMQMKEGRGKKKTGLKLNIQKTKIGIQSHHFMARNEETMETVTLYFFGLQNQCRWLLQP